MAVLRVMNRPDEFELTALDFCVTYEVSPPGWERPRCHFKAMTNGAVDPDEGASVLGEVVRETVSSGYTTESGAEGPSTEFNHLGLVELSGEIRGDPQATLEDLEHRLQGADVMIISCRNLIRVDFSAAGSILNWVSAHHALGRCWLPAGAGSLQGGQGLGGQATSHQLLRWPWRRPGPPCRPAPWICRPPGGCRQ